MAKYKVAIMMGSKSDAPIMDKAAETLKTFGVESEVVVASAHRQPEKVHELAQRYNNECQAIIAGAGMAAHLPGVLASLVTIPIIGVPIAASFDGLDSLMSIAQMPPGIPVATVAVNGAKNAALLAVQIIGVSDSNMRQKLIDFRESLK